MSVIFESAIAIFDNCVNYAKTRVVSGSTATFYITAANMPPTQRYGCLFRNARLKTQFSTHIFQESACCSAAGAFLRLGEFAGFC